MARLIPDPLRLLQLMEEVFCPSCGVKIIDGSLPECESLAEHLSAGISCSSCRWSGRRTELRAHNEHVPFAFWLRSIHEHDGEAHRIPPPPRCGTDYMPGSAEKIDLMHERFKKGFSLWHALDARLSETDKLRRVTDPGRNGILLGKSKWKPMDHHLGKDRQKREAV